MSSPNFDAPFCACQWFDRAAKDPGIPIIFDEQMNEFHLVHTNGRGHLSMYHCPFCGGRAPESLRDTFFTEVSSEESARLFLLTKEIKTEEEMISTFGPPDHELAISGSVTSPGSDTEAPETSVGGRQLIYKHLSETADVNVRIGRYGQLHFSFGSKYIGPKNTDGV